MSIQHVCGVSNWPVLLAGTGATVAAGVLAGTTSFLVLSLIRRRLMGRGAGRAVESMRISEHLCVEAGGEQPHAPWLLPAFATWSLERTPAAMRTAAHMLGGRIAASAARVILLEPSGHTYLNQTQVCAESIVAMAACASLGLVGVTALGGGLRPSALALLLGLLLTAAAARAPYVMAIRWRRRRSQTATKELPVLIDTIALCSRAGMSFDQALALYCSRFSTVMAEVLGGAYSVWRSGLSTRHRELSRVQERMDSPVLDGFLTAVLQAIDLGTPMSVVLIAQAAEARAEQRAALDERVAKLPTKLLIPIGLFTLPAMLILLLAPIAMQVLSGLG